ncbi:hypothetical protein ACFP1Z_28985 [Streptomyces gamaensis]|uniref:Uncharacterized protein n=1 Tax=Streptomyces gamaensis TaxID=1763542 RepID=A0ABW0ZCY0_9ACTN
MRAYQPYAKDAPDAAFTPAEPTRYLGEGRKLDLVLQFREPSGEVDGWLEFVRKTVRDQGARIATLQICEEPNADLPVLDGSTPNVLQALVRGVTAAKEEARSCGHDVAVGFNAVPAFDAGSTFWRELGALADDRFHEALDYVGLDFFPDVFRPVAAGQLPDAVRAVLRQFRDVSLPQAGIGTSVPVRVCENGWPTGPDRSEERQAEVVEDVVRTVAALRDELAVSGYSFFDLRDADSAGTGLFDRFGLLRDDCTPKPAFETYRRLIQELTV